MSGGQKRGRELGPFDKEEGAVNLDSAKPIVVEQEFDIELDRLENVALRPLHNSIDSNYHELSPTMKSNLRDALEDKHGFDPVESVYNFIWDWKESVGENWKQAQTLELIAKKGLGTDALVRTKNKEHPVYTGESIPPDDPRIDVYQDLVRVSRAFVRVSLSNKRIEDITDDTNPVLDLSRGPGYGAPEFISKSFDFPSAGFFNFETSVLTGYSDQGDIAQYYGDAIAISDMVPLDHIAVAVDFILPTPFHEAEYHVDKRMRKIASKYIKYVGNSRQHPLDVEIIRKLSDDDDLLPSTLPSVSTIRKAIQNEPTSEKATLFFDLVQTLWNRDATVERDQGIKTLQNGQEAIQERIRQTNDSLEIKRLENIQDQIDDLIEWSEAEPE